MSVYCVCVRVCVCVGDSGAEQPPLAETAHTRTHTSTHARPRTQAEDERIAGNNAMHDGRLMDALAFYDRGLVLDPESKLLLSNRYLRSFGLFFLGGGGGEIERYR